MSWICSARIAEVDQGRAERLVGDLEISAAGELLEFDEGEIGLDAGGVAIHEQADGAGGGDDGGLGVAIAVLFAEDQGAVPAFAGGKSSLRGAIGWLSANCDASMPDRLDIERFVFAQALGGGGVVATTS